MSRKSFLVGPRSAAGVRSAIAFVAALALAMPVIALWPIEAARAGKAPPPPPPPTYTSSLDNGVVKVGIDANLGGAITYLSRSGSSTNLINTYDHGREVQQSYYAGPNLDRRAEGQHPWWSPWPWNPIGAGDAYGNRSIVLGSNITPTTLYVRSQPLLWDMSAERCQCEFQTWISLEGRRVRIHNRLTTSRTDNRWAAVTRGQEVPATYPIADLSRIVSYTGDQPFTGGATSVIPKPATTWVANWDTLEHWGACVNAGDFGVGVYTPGRTSFGGGLYGRGRGSSTSSDTCYVAPLEGVPLDKTSTFQYDSWLVVGTLDQIRQEVYALHQARPEPPAGFPWTDAFRWNFNADGDFGGWSLDSSITSSSVSGGTLNGVATTTDPYMFSAAIEKPAAESKVGVRLRNGTASSHARLSFITKPDEASWENWREEESKRIAILPNSDFTVYTFDMSTVPAWTGTITGLRLEPVEAGGPFAIDWIRIGNF